MYTEGLQIGENLYIFQDDYGTITLLEGTGTSNEMNEYIKLKNEYEERGENYFELYGILQEVKGYDKEAKRLRNRLCLGTILAEGIFIIVGAVNLNYLPEILISIGTIGFTISMITPSILYGTKKKRIKIISEATGELEIEEKKIKKIVEKLQILNRKIEYEMIVDKKEENVVPITTVENKKANVKIRVLKLEQSR